MKSSIVISFERMPEMLWAMRHELAKILRAEAGAESDPRVARRLIEIAATFETGQLEAL